MSVWRLQYLALTAKLDDPDRARLIARYGEYVRAVRGLSWMRWTPGLRAWVGLTEMTDADIMRGQAGSPVRDLSASDLRAVAFQGGQAKLIDAADAGGAEGIDLGLQAAHAGHDIMTGEPWRPPEIDDPPPILKKHMVNSPDAPTKGNKDDKTA